MAQEFTAPKALRFEDYEVDLRAGQLLKHGLRISLREKSFQLLAVLIAHSGQVVTREELRLRLWPRDVFVDFDNNLNTAIATLREALGDSADHPRFIETLPKRGYRFIAEVSEAAGTRQPARSPGRTTRPEADPRVSLTFGSLLLNHFSEGLVYAGDNLMYLVECQCTCGALLAVPDMTVPASV